MYSLIADAAKNRDAMVKRELQHASIVDYMFSAKYDKPLHEATTIVREAMQLIEDGGNYGGWYGSYHTFECFANYFMRKRHPGVSYITYTQCAMFFLFEECKIESFTELEESEEAQKKFIDLRKRHSKWRNVLRFWKTSSFMEKTLGLRKWNSNYV